MSLDNLSFGEGYVPAYQMSATPFVTSSNVTLGEVKKIAFDNVSRFLIVKNTGASTDVLAVAFTRNGLKPVQSNCFFLSGSESFSAELRTNSLYLSGAAGNPNFSIIAGLTFINSKMMQQLTGSAGINGVG